MSFISPAKHNKFMEVLASSIKTFSRLSVKEEVTIEKLPDLEHDLDELNKVFEEYNSREAELRMLIKKYNDIQRRARVILRHEKFKYTKNFGPISISDFL